MPEVGLEREHEQIETSLLERLDEPVRVELLQAQVELAMPPPQAGQHPRQQIGRHGRG